MIEVSGVSKTYGKVKALEAVSFTIGKGEVFGLLGPNGAGKTTLIKILTTLSRPDTGTCRIGGVDVVTEPLEIKRRIGVVPQENNLDRELTARENLSIYCRLHDVPRREEKIRASLEAVGLLDRADSVVSQFSGGMQRRLLLARASLPEPSVLFLDEPSIGLDPVIRRRLWETIRATRREGRTVVITTHYIEEAEALCDRVGILSRGKLIALDTPAGLKAQVGSYVAESTDDTGRIQQHICGHRDEAYRVAQTMEGPVTVRRTNLEDVFVRLTGERIE